MSCKITERSDGYFLCTVEIQDGTERWLEASLDKALDSVKEAERFLNGRKIKKKNIPIYRVVLVPSDVRVERIQ